MMFLIATIALFVGMCLVLARLYAGPSLYDRVLAANAFGTFTVMFIGVLGFLMERPEFLDIALLYALINFVGTIAVLKYFRYRAIGDTSPTPEGEPTSVGKLNDRGVRS
ncbi:MAG: cation:proton antiporter [Rhizobiaceae bacterium]|nr:cation:proton antiporter [Rhizobiaceae bacterium]